MHRRRPKGNTKVETETGNSEKLSDLSQITQLDRSRTGVSFPHLSFLVHVYLTLPPHPPIKTMLRLPSWLPPGSGRFQPSLIPSPTWGNGSAADSSKHEIKHLPAFPNPQVPSPCYIHLVTPTHRRNPRRVCVSSSGANRLHRFR